MDLHADHDRSGGKWHNSSFHAASAFYIGWLGALAWATVITPGTLTAETDISLTGITVFLSAGFLLIYDRDLSFRLRHLYHALRPSLPRHWQRLLARMLRLGWFSSRARSIRRTVEACLLGAIAIIPVLWMLGLLFG